MNYKEEVDAYFDNYVHKIKRLEIAVEVAEERYLELINIAKDKGEKYFYLTYVAQRGDTVYTSSGAG